MKSSYGDMADLLTLPLKRDGIKAHYEGSIDKKGANADWDWFLYQDHQRNDEWVLFDAIGPGCVYNFVQHRYTASEEPTFRFYFDGELTPRFEIKPSQFGEKYPFVEPLASAYIGPIVNDRSPIRVVRSFVPMPFAKSCRITSDVKLEGCSEASGQGGWGHVVYHLYSDVGEGEVVSFDPKVDVEPIRRLWKRTGSTAVIPFEQEEKQIISFKLAPRSSQVVYDRSGAGLISGIQFVASRYDKALLHDLHLRAYWNGSGKADVDCDFGCFFTNECGAHSVTYLLSGMDIDGRFYNNYPMPYDRGARIEIENVSDREIDIPYCSIRSTCEYNDFYASHPHHLFRSSAYYERKCTIGSDSKIARVTGNGHFVASVVTASVTKEGDWASCEGDVRVHIDGIRTPQIESDGSESFACYGWGFGTPPECNPASGYDGVPLTEWSELRSCMGDVYPFCKELCFNIESGGNNDYPLNHSGIIFYYGSDETKMSFLANIPVPEDHRVPLTTYFEGDDDDIEVSYEGVYGQEMECEIDLPGNCRNIMLRRVSDQQNGRQWADVYVDGKLVEGRPWYFADSNPYKRWLEDEYVIPNGWTKGKKSIRVKLVPRAVDGKTTFNVFNLDVYSLER